MDINDDAMLKVEEFLDHHGVKGQKWGVRRAQKKSARQDKKFARKNLRGITAHKLYKEASAKFDSEDLPRINAKYKDGDLLVNKKLGERYEQEILTSFNKRFEEAAHQRVSKSGNTRLTGAFNLDTRDYLLSIEDIKHSIPDGFSLKIERDEKGFITKLEVSLDASLEMSDVDDTAVEEFLEHHGVKGQKWGVRRSKKVLEKSRKEHIKNLSDEELKKYVSRLEMEKRASDLSRPQQSASKEFVKKHGSQAVSVTVGAASSAVATALIKKALKKP